MVVPHNWHEGIGGCLDALWGFSVCVRHSRHKRTVYGFAGGGGVYDHPFAAGFEQLGVSQSEMRGGVRVRWSMSSRAAMCARRCLRRVASSRTAGFDQCVRPALKSMPVVLPRYAGDVCVCVPLRAANMGAGEVGEGLGLRCLMSSPVIVSGGGRLGLRARCNRWPRSERRSFFGIGWIVLDSVHASWKSLIVSSVNELAAEAAVAGFGMVAANISCMAGVMRPEADWRRRLSSACGDAGAFPNASSVSAAHAGCSGMDVCCGCANIIAARASAGWKVGGAFSAFLRLVAHQLARASWCRAARGKAVAAASFSQTTSASVFLYGVKPKGDRVPRCTW